MIIGFTGPAGSGKDTAADYMTNVLGGGWRKISFADPIKEMLKVGLMLTDEQLYGDQKEVEDPRYEATPRYLMQTLGTEWGRDLVHHQLWVRATAARLRPRNIIADVRFNNEADLVRSRGVLIHIRGRGQPTDHQSEQGVIPQHGDYMINNDDTLENFYKQLDEVMKWF